MDEDGRAWKRSIVCSHCSVVGSGHSNSLAHRPGPPAVHSLLLKSPPHQRIQRGEPNVTDLNSSLVFAMKNNLNNMKNLLKKSQNRLSTTFTQALSKPLEPPAMVAAVTPNIYSSGIGLKPRDILPAVPHSYPYHCISVLASKDGLLLRPDLQRDAQPTNHVCVAWGQDVIVEEREGDGSSPGHDWSGAAVVFGVLGVVKLFSCEILLRPVRC